MVYEVWSATEDLPRLRALTPAICQQLSTQLRGSPAPTDAPPTLQRRLIEVDAAEPIPPSTEVVDTFVVVDRALFELLTGPRKASALAFLVALVEAQRDLVALDLGGFALRDPSDHAWLMQLESWFRAVVVPPVGTVQIAVGEPDPVRSRRGEPPEEEEDVFAEAAEHVWAVPPADRSESPDLKPLEHDDLVGIECEDGAIEWMLAGHYAARYPQGPTHRHPSGSWREARTVRGQRLGAYRLPRAGLDKALASIVSDATQRSAFLDALARAPSGIPGFDRDSATVHVRHPVRLLAALAEDLNFTLRQAETPGGTVDLGQWLTHGTVTLTPGQLYGVDKQGRLQSLQQPKQSDKPLLLMVHGTFKPTEAGFKPIFQDSPWDRFVDAFDNRVAYQHRQWSVSPIVNAAHLLRCLESASLLGTPQNPRKVVLLSHSRGGLVGELLCAPPNVAPSDEWSVAHKSAWSVVQELAPRVDIQRFVRVAAPVRGTSLMSGRLDRFVTMVLVAARILLGAGASPVLRPLSIVFRYLLKWVKDPKLVPGLAHQAPESELVRWLGLSGAAHVVSSRLYVVAADAAPNPTLKRTAAWATARLVFGQANDFVVDTDYMVGGWRRADGLEHRLRRSNGRIGHSSYFRLNHGTRWAVVQAVVDNDPSQFEQAGRGSDRGLGLTFSEMVHIEDGYATAKTHAADATHTVVLIPGILGSHLKRTDGTHRRVWVSVAEALSGGIADLRMLDDSIEATSAIQSYYGTLGKELKEDGARVEVFPYDWRRSFLASDGLGKKLYDHLANTIQRWSHQPIHVVAHSMGGLVLRAALLHGRKIHSTNPPPSSVSSSRRAQSSWPAHPTGAPPKPSECCPSATTA